MAATAIILEFSNLFAYFIYKKTLVVLKIVSFKTTPFEPAAVRNLVASSVEHNQRVLKQRDLSQHVLSHRVFGQRVVSQRDLGQRIIQRLFSKHIFSHRVLSQRVLCEFFLSTCPKYFFLNFQYKNRYNHRLTI